MTMSLCRSLIFPACAIPVLAAVAIWHHHGDFGAPSGLRGRYVEARSASVFAGACHFNSESTTQGREAVLAFAIDSGREGGVDLAGMRIVAAVVAERNLAEADAERSSVVYLPESASAEQRAAALEALEKRCGSLLGSVREVRTASVEVESDGSEYSVLVASPQGPESSIGPTIEIRGATLPDRACCTMPQNVWYEPMVSLRERVVGHCERFTMREPLLGAPFTRSDENNAFVGSFAPRRCCDGPCERTRTPAKPQS
jgi:hypothetical protein